MNSQLPNSKNRSQQPVEISLDKIDRLDDARELDESNITHLQASIADHGLLQAIVVVAEGNRFRCVIGNHRLEAIRRNGNDKIAATIWPEGTSQKKILLSSLQENSVRKSESIPDIFHRVSVLAEINDCDFPTAARLAKISDSKFSKINTTVEKLCPKALELVAKKKIGIGVAYETAKAAKDHSQQVAWLSDHANGKMSRDAIIEAGKANLAKPKRCKTVTLDLAVDDVTIKMCVPVKTSYERLFEVLSKATKCFKSHDKLGDPIDLLPRLMKERGELCSV